MIFFFLIEFQFEVEQFKIRLEQELLEKEILKTQMNALNSENQSWNKKVICSLFYVVSFNLKYICQFLLSPNLNLNNYGKD
jgi:hypothetical protein